MNIAKIAQRLYFDLRGARPPRNSTIEAFRTFLTPTVGQAPAPKALNSVVDSKVATGAATALTTATAKTVTSIVLTPGVWNVVAHVNHNGAGATRTAASAAISETTNTLTTDGSEAAFGTPTTTATFVDGTSLQAKRIVVASGSKTVYLVTSATFSAGTVAAWGQITAERVA